MKTTCVWVSTFEQKVSRQLVGKDDEMHWDKISVMVALGKKIG